MRKKSEFVSGLGTAFEFVKAISDEVCELGGGDDDLRKVIAQATLRRNLAQLIMGKLKLADHPSDALAAQHGFTVLEDVAPSEFKVADLELVPFLKNGESFINGETLRTRAVTLKANLGLVDAKYILDHKAEIPTEFRRVLVFTGTLLRGSDGDLRVAVLYWLDGRWCLNFNWVGNGFDDYSRLVRCKS